LPCWCLFGIFEHMSEQPINDSDVITLSGVDLLILAVDRLLAEDPVDLPGQLALDRTRTLIQSSERLQAARLAAISDMDRRELWSLDGAGSTRGWLRTQLGGEKGQLSAARRLEQRPVVEAALAAGQVSGRGAEQLCGVLDKVPTQVDEEQLSGVIIDGVGGLLQASTGGLVLDDAITADLLAARAEADAVLQACAADTTASPACRLEPAFVLLARRLAPGHLGPALRQLIEALLPDGSDGLDSDPYFFELRELLDGDVDVRGHLTPEVGHALAAEVARRVALLKAAEKAPAKEEPSVQEPQDGAAPDLLPVEPLWEEPPTNDDQPAARTTEPGNGPADQPDPAREDGEGIVDSLAAWDAAWEATKRTGSEASAESHLPTPPRPISAGRRRHDALARLLHDLQHIEPGSGQPSPTHLTVVATIDAIEGRLGALPGVLGTRGQPASLSRETLARLGCYSELNVVLLDAYGNAVGASHSRRNLTRRERRALRAQWGPTCAIDGCTSTATVPHHVEPYWMSRRTRLRDMIPACEHCHHDLHDGHRTLRLRDGRLIKEQKWVTTAAAAA